jgi:hypothetical protein
VRRAASNPSRVCLLGESGRQLTRALSGSDGDGYLDLAAGKLWRNVDGNSFELVNASMWTAQTSSDYTGDGASAWLGWWHTWADYNGGAWPPAGACTARTRAATCFADTRALSGTQTVRTTSSRRTASFEATLALLMASTAASSIGPRSTLRNPSGRA